MTRPPFMILFLNPAPRYQLWPHIVIQFFIGHCKKLLKGDSFEVRCVERLDSDLIPRLPVRREGIEKGPARYHWISQSEDFYITACPDSLNCFVDFADHAGRFV